MRSFAVFAAQDDSRRVLSFAACLLLALPLFASDLQVDKRTLSIDDSLTITITLIGAFASVDNIQLPLQNLLVDGSPAVSSEFSWINGQASRRKVFRYRAHPRGPGAALIGPVTLRGGDGQVETLAPVSIQVLPDRTAGSNDPVRILHELLATGRDPIFVVADADKTSAFVGEQVIVTWTIYNATNVQQHGVGEIPKLADFWVEELDVRGETPQQIFIGGVAMQKLVIRRVALFPLRSGVLTIDPTSVEAQIMKRVDIGNPFGMFEGTVVDVHRRSAPLTIDARPIPPGQPVAAVGDLSLQCLTPVQKNGGPVSIDVLLSGPANLRAAPPPAFANTLDGSVQIAEGGVSVHRHEDAVMTRRWRFLIFPASSGMFVVPPLATTILTPAGVRRELRCEQRALLVETAGASANPPPASAQPRDARLEAARRSLPFAGIAALILIVLAIAWPRIQRARRIRRHTRALVRETPAETRIAVDEWLVARGVDLSALVREPSDRGDAYRALRSLLNAAERDRLVAEPAEIRARVRELVAARSRAM
ncbi:MAG: BatD family protein [Acidobacteriota bacterium]|nr:BatD family protein [Acidobacteriota bacterium]